MTFNLEMKLWKHVFVCVHVKERARERERERERAPSSVENALRTKVKVDGKRNG